MNESVKNHIKIGLADGIEREICELFHNLCAAGNINMDISLHTAKLRYRLIRKYALQMHSMIEEEEHHAHEIATAKESDVRSGQREINFGNPQKGWEGIRQER